MNKHSGIVARSPPKNKNESHKNNFNKNNLLKGNSMKIMYINNAGVRPVCLKFA